MRALLLVVPLLLAGCLESVPGIQTATTSGSSYRFIEVQAEFKAQPEEERGGVCGYASTPVVDPEAQSVLFYNDWPGRDFGVLILTVTWDRTYCGTASTTWATSHQLDVVVEDEGGRRFEFTEDGTLLVDGTPVPRGGSEQFARRGTLSDGRTYHHEMTVTDHGAWPRAGLALAE